MSYWLVILSIFVLALCFCFGDINSANKSESLLLDLLISSSCAVQFLRLSMDDLFLVWRYWLLALELNFFHKMGGQYMLQIDLLCCSRHFSWFGFKLSCIHGLHGHHFCVILSSRACAAHMLHLGVLWTTLASSFLAFNSGWQWILKEKFIRFYSQCGRFWLGLGSWQHTLY